MEFDILDTDDGSFLSTERRHSLLKGAAVEAVPVLHEGKIASLKELKALIKKSLFKSGEWRARLEAAAVERGLEVDRVLRETDLSEVAEGLYIKVEEQGRVVGRYKFVRASFLTSVFASESHWLNRPILPNGLRPGVELFGGAK